MINNNSKSVLVTSALPYVNNIPHLGNIIGSTLSGDVYSRFLKSKNIDVLYLCGTDEYGTTTEVKAKQENLTCQQICDKYHILHKQVYDWFNIKFDIWGRTTTKTQTEITHQIFTELYKNNHIEEKELIQKFCNNCNMFLADRFLQGVCYHNECVKYMKENNTIINAHGDQCDKCHNLIDIEKFEKSWCSECKTVPENKKTWHLYLKLNNFKDDLQKYFIDDKKCTLTDNAFTITKSWLDKGLESRCITRDLKWGTPFPKIKGLEKYFDKVFYVWFDAPIGYLSILKHNLKDEKEYHKWLSGDIVNFMAKDNVPFHTVIFPSTLLGSNYCNLVSKLSSTEYLNYEGTKFSKSKNIGVFGDQIIDISNKLNIDEDYWRYYLMRIRPETKDSNFNWSEFITLVNSELCGKIGNLINRCISLVNKYFSDNKLFTYDSKDSIFSENFSKIQYFIHKYDEFMEKFKFRDALYTAIEVSDFCNNFLQSKQPWKLTDEDNYIRKNILTDTIFICYNLLKLLQPFMPNKINNLLKTFIFDNSENNTQNFSGKFTINIQNYKLPFCQLDKTKVFNELNKLNIYIAKV